MENKIISWTGEDGLQWQAEIGIHNSAPCIFSLSYERAGEQIELASMLYPQFRVVTSKRTTHNPQRVKPLEEGEEPAYQWDTYSDDPMSRKEFVKESDEKWNTTEMRVSTDGNRTTVSFDGLTLGQFTGGCDFNFFNGTNLIRMEAVAATEEDGVAYLYHAGLKGFDIGKLYYVTPKRREIYENPGLKMHTSPERDRERVLARGRTLTLGLTNGSVAAFPSPHRFFWGAQTENIVGYNYYNREKDGTLAIGVRHNKSPEHWNIRWPCYNAKPGTVQKMSAFFMPTAESVYTTRAMVMKYTNFDHLRELKGYKRLLAHMHVATHSAWIRDKRVQRPWEKLIRELGGDIFAPCDFWGEGSGDIDNKDLRRADMERYNEMAKYCSTDDFLVIPAEEIGVRNPAKELIRFHCMFFPSKPMLYSRWRDDDQEFAEKLPDGRTYYHLKSSDDFIEMCRRENGFVLMPHPDTKANDGLPYDCRGEAWFEDERWFGVGCRQLPADNSLPHMISGRTERVWNDVNNWSTTGPKYIISELDTYTKVEESEEDWEMYPMTNCTYVQLDKLPSSDDWGELVDALREGRHFYSTGEILLEKCTIEDGTCDAVISWTYPMQYAQLIYSDGENVTTLDLSMTDSKPYGVQSLHFDFPKGMKWARVQAVDIAGNSVFGMPVFLRK